jgi:hypothetical protein
MKGRVTQSLQQVVWSSCFSDSDHDGHALATIMAEDVDFVTVGLTW